VPNASDHPPVALIALDAVPLPLAVLGPDWRLHGTNAALARLLGRVPPNATHLAELFERGPSVIERLTTSLRSTHRATATAVIAGGAEVDIVVEDSAGDRRVAMFILADSRVALRQELERVQKALAEAERDRSKMDTLQRELVDATRGGAPRIIGTAAPVLVMLQQVERVAPSSATVLIRGESGSGKELVARTIHAQSRRASRTLVAVNCAAMPETLLESELFGHERGAFTGADRQRLGKFELADGGTLFLDEVAELSLPAQAKLLRVLQEGTFERVGGTETIRVDVRVVAATHRDLLQQVERGRFREDIFYRLNVFTIGVPPLRDRREDIRPLAEFFHEHHARLMAREVLPISERSMRRLMTYRWPGNVRELENAIERATLLASGAELEVELPQAPASPGSGTASGGGRDTSQVPRDVLLDLSHDQLQRLQIMHALETREYRVFGVDGAAAKLGLNPQTLLSRMDKLGIPRPRIMRKAMKGDFT